MKEMHKRNSLVHMLILFRLKTKFEVSVCFQLWNSLEENPIFLTFRMILLVACI